MVWRYSIATCWAEAMLRTSKTDTGRVSCKTLVSQSGPKSMPQPIYQKIVLKSNNFSNLKCPKTTIQYYRLVPNARCVTWFICGVNYLALVANPFDVSAPSCISSPYQATNQLLNNLLDRNSSKNENSCKISLISIFSFFQVLILIFRILSYTFILPI